MKSDDTSKKFQYPNEILQNSAIQADIVSINNKSDNTDILINKYMKDGQKAYKVLKYA